MGNYGNEQALIEINNLPSERWKIRRIRTARDKELRRLDKECRHVSELIRNLGYEELNPPIQRGYKRLFVLTEETKRSSKADFYQGILDKINTIWYSPVKTFNKDRKRKIAKWRYRRRAEQLLQEPDEWAFGKSGKFTEEEAQLFHRIDYYSYPSKRWMVKYVFCEPWRFVLRVRPNMITKVKRKDLVLEQYQDELESQRDRNWGRLVKIWGGNTNSWNTYQKQYIPKEKYKYNPVKNKNLWEIMEEYKEEKELWEYEQKI
jgi:hypothetical protein